MRIKRNILMLCLLPLIAAACSSDANDDGLPRGDRMRVEVAAEISTRTSVDGKSFIAGDSFLLYEDKPAHDNNSKAAYTYAGGSWSGTPGLFWDDLDIWDAAGVIRNADTYFTAVLTNNGNLTLASGGNSFAIAQDQRGNDAAWLKNDLLVAYGTANASDVPASRKLSLDFKHVFAQLRIKITENTESGDNSLPIMGADTRIRISEAKNENSVAFDASAGSVTVVPSGDQKEITLRNVSSGSTYEYNVILPAQDLSSSKLVITDNANGKEYFLDLSSVTVSEGDGNLLQQHKLTTLSLKIQKKKIVLGKVMVTDWTDRSSSGIATPDDYPEIIIGGDDGGGGGGTIEPGDDYAGKTIKLNGDVDASTLNLPIGTKSVPFRGTFDGQGYKIYGIDLESAEAFLGVFGYTDGATIRNLNVEGIKIKNNNNSTNTATGGLAGYVNNTLIENCHVLGYTGGVSALYDNAGGLVGYIHGATEIRSSSASTRVEAGHDYVGGFVGKAEDGMVITECFATGEVASPGGYYVGGFAGYTYNGKIGFCYAWGSVTASRFAGGLIGRAIGTSVGNSYAAGRSVTGGATQGGLIGYSETDPQYCYWNAALAGGKGATGNLPDATNSGFTLLKTEAAMGTVLNGLNRREGNEPKLWELGVDSEEYVLPVLINNKGQAKP